MCWNGRIATPGRAAPFITFSRYLNSLDGQIFVFLVMTVAAAEVAVGLAIVVSIFRLKVTTDVEEINLMKW